jgi:hypothetical protein
MVAKKWFVFAKAVNPKPLVRLLLHLLFLSLLSHGQHLFRVTCLPENLF